MTIGGTVLDFVRVRKETVGRGPGLKIYPDFLQNRYKDLMVRGGAFYAVWDEGAGTWSTDQERVNELVDAETWAVYEELTDEARESASPQLMISGKSNLVSEFQRNCKIKDRRFRPLNQRVLFQSDKPSREDYSTFRLSYDRYVGDTPNYNGLMQTVYDPEELRKLEWAVGAVFTGEAKDIQKMLVIFGAPGTGKSTYIKLLEWLFEGYATAFKAGALGKSDDRFSVSAFSEDPLLAFEHDGDLSKIESNTLLNSIISHEPILVEEKYKSPYQSRVGAMLVVGTNTPVLMSGLESGLMRRVIDVYSSGRTLPIDQYNAYLSGIKFELGAIADHCIKLYQSMGPAYYDGYRPVDMVMRTNVLYNFVDENRQEFSTSEYVPLLTTYNRYKQYCEAANERPIMLRVFKEQLKSYFEQFLPRAPRNVDTTQPRNVYVGFKSDVMPSLAKPESREPESIGPWLQMTETTSLLDDILADKPAQYATDNGTPIAKWATVETTLADLDTSKVHYVKPGLNHIVIDFDIKNESGEKDAEANISAASKWPRTYGEHSKSGGGVHLHYSYVGDAQRLSRVFAPGIEIKVFVGDSSLRRAVSTCNDLPVSTLSSGLPLKEEKVIDQMQVRSERSLRILIEKNLHKLIHPGTKPSVDFIHKILNDAYRSDLVYDLEDMKPRIVGFAANSTNQSVYCMRLVNDMPFKSRAEPAELDSPDDRLTFFDVEVFPNLFVICWKFQGGEVVRMINPTAEEVAGIMALRLVGFNNRRYDNHILYAAYMGYGREALYDLSQKLISKERSPFGAAYSVSYTDVWDFNSNKQSLKKWQIELGIDHVELGLPWHEPVPEHMWSTVADYCANDVIATEKVFEARSGDWAARQILSKLSGQNVNTPTNTHSAWIVFGTNKPDKSQFVYTDLSERFEGYEYSFGKSTYKGLDPSEGGYVNEQVGMYSNVAVLDVASMHPTSIIELNLFGDEYTTRYRELLEARLAIKHQEHDKLENLLGGSLREYVSGGGDLLAMSNALKIVLNSVYGLTSASFDNPFRDPRNVDNIVAKRGALFMIDLNEYVRDCGFEVIHTKTDSVKIPEVGANPIFVEAVQRFSKGYGYEMEWETTYDRLCLVNKSTYIGVVDGKWDAVGAEFKRPYVYKTLLSGEAIGFDDLVETKEVKTSIWIAPPEGFGDLHFVGRVGSFVPVISGGGQLLRLGEENSYSAVTGTKGYLWREARVEKEMSDGRLDNIDMSYFDKLVDDAMDKLRAHGDVEWLLHA